MWKHLNPLSSCAVEGCSAWGFKFMLYDAKFDSEEHYIPNF
jgi:hypothetical protein